MFLLRFSDLETGIRVWAQDLVVVRGSFLAEPCCSNVSCGSVQTQKIRGGYETGTYSVLYAGLGLMFTVLMAMKVPGVLPDANVNMIARSQWQRCACTCCGAGSHFSTSTAQVCHMGKRRLPKLASECAREGFQNVVYNIGLAA